MTRSARHRARRTATTWALFGALTSTLGAHAAAQAGAQADTKASSLETITTDTGAFAPGYRDFSRYDTPGFCLAALRRSERLARRSLEVQSLIDTLEDVRLDTIGHGRSVTLAGTCAAKFGLRDHASQASARDLPDLFAIAVLTRNDTLAQQFLAQQVALAPTADQKAELQLTALRTLLGWAPYYHQRVAPLMGAAQQVIAVLDRDGSLPQRVQLRRILTAFWEQQDSLLALQPASESLLAVIRQTPAKLLLPRDVAVMRYESYRNLTVVALFSQTDPQQTRTALERVAERAKRDSVDVFDDTKTYNTHDLSIPELIKLFAPSRLAWDPSARGDAIRVRARFWYPADGANGGNPGSSRDTIQPVPGRPTLFVVGGNHVAAQRVRHWAGQPFSQQSSHQSGLAITIVQSIADTAAMWWSNGLLDGPIDGALTAAARAEDARWYYHDFEHLPATVAIQTWHDVFPPWPNDARRTAALPQLDSLWGAHGDPSVNWGGMSEPGSVMLTDHEGRVVWDGDPVTWRQLYHTPIDRLFQWIVAQAPAATASTPSSSSSHSQEAR